MEYGGINLRKFFFNVCYAEYANCVNNAVRNRTVDTGANERT